MTRPCCAVTLSGWCSPWCVSLPSAYVHTKTRLSSRTGCWTLRNGPCQKKMAGGCLFISGGGRYSFELLLFIRQTQVLCQSCCRIRCHASHCSSSLNVSSYRSKGENNSTGLSVVMLKAQIQALRTQLLHRDSSKCHICLVRPPPH